MTKPQEVARLHDAPMAISDPGSILQVIERAAKDPTIDVQKMERLMAMAERVAERQAKAAYFEAMAEMQTELPTIAERGKIDIGKGKPQAYALWEDINDIIKPIMSKHGFALSFRTGFEESKITVTGVLSHRDGHSEQTTIHLPSDTSGSKNAVQAVGSSTQYGKRYTAAALLNLTSRGEDDDGMAAGGGKINDAQVEIIRSLIADTGADIEKFCAFLKVQAVTDILVRDYDKAMGALMAKKTRRA